MCARSLRYVCMRDVAKHEEVDEEAQFSAVGSSHNPAACLSGLKDGACGVVLAPRENPWMESILGEPRQPADPTPGAQDAKFP